MKGQNFSANDALDATSSFMAVRTFLYLICTIILFVFGIASVVFLSNYDINNLYLLIGILIFILANLITSFIDRYFIFMIKVGHTYSLSEYIMKGSVSDNIKGFSSIFNFGLNKLEDNFSSIKTAYEIDNLVLKSVRQITHFLNKKGNLLSFVPGSDQFMSLVERILNTSLNAIKDSIINDVICNKDEANPWKKACDSTTRFGQSWDNMVRNSTRISLSIFFVRAVIIISSVLGGFALGGSFGFLYGIVIAWSIVYAINHIIVEPFTTVVLLNDYCNSTSNITIQIDLFSKFATASRKFRILVDKTNKHMVEYKAKKHEENYDNKDNTEKKSVPEDINGDIDKKSIPEDINGDIDKNTDENIELDVDSTIDSND